MIVEFKEAVQYTYVLFSGYVLTMLLIWKKKKKKNKQTRFAFPGSFKLNICELPN